MNNPNTTTNNCNSGSAPCNVTPIVMPSRVRTVNRCYYYEQPIIVPCHTRVVNNYYPCARYYPQYTTSEENVCYNANNQMTS